MKWAIEIRSTSLDHRNLTDLLRGLGYELVEGIDFEALYSPQLDKMENASEVWNQGKKIRDAFTGPAAIDPDFSLGSIVTYSRSNRKRHTFIEAETGHLKLTAQSATVSGNIDVSSAEGLSDDEHRAIREKLAEQTYQAELEAQRQKLEPAFFEPRAAKVLEFLASGTQTGETLYKIYETMEVNPSNRTNFLQQFDIPKVEFDRFSDAVHNPVVTGDFARHAYEKKPKSENPMTISEATTFIDSLSNKWLETIRKERDENTEL